MYINPDLITKRNETPSNYKKDPKRLTDRQADFPLANIKGLPNSFFAHNKQRFIDHLKGMLVNFDTNSILVLQGGKDHPRYDTDVVWYHFQQETNFYYLTGVVEPDFTLVINFNNNESTLFMPLPDERSKIFMHIPSLEDVTKKYEITCKDAKDFYKFINEINPNTIYRLKGKNSDSGLNITSFNFNPPEEYSKLSKLINDDSLVYEILAETRSRKSIEEYYVMLYANQCNVEAHKEVLKAIKPDLNERDLENVHKGYLRNKYYQRSMAYNSVCGGGKNSSTLHYDENNQQLIDGDLYLLDNGFRLANYTSDVTSTIPVNGKFTDKQAEIYNIVLDASKTVMNNVRASVYWPDMHVLAERVILTGLKKLNLLNDLDIEEMLKDRLGYYFMPHGLGHLIGLETHDVGGYLSFTPPRIDEKGLSSLRTARYLAESTMITIEPGCYFIEFLLEQGFKDEKVSKYFNQEKLKEYYNFGGVRIEDNVFITDTGCINFNEGLPRTVEEIEQAMKK